MLLANTDVIIAVQKCRGNAISITLARHHYMDLLDVTQMLDMKELHDLNEVG